MNSGSRNFLHFYITQTGWGFSQSDDLSADYSSVCVFGEDKILVTRFESDESLTVTYAVNRGSYFQMASQNFPEWSGSKIVCLDIGLGILNGN